MSILNIGSKSGSLTYRTNDGTALGVSTDGTMTFTLAQGSTVYASPLTKDIIGISTARVGLDLKLDFLISGRIIASFL